MFYICVLSDIGGNFLAVRFVLERLLPFCHRLVDEIDTLSGGGPDLSLYDLNRCLLFLKRDTEAFLREEIGLLNERFSRQFEEDTRGSDSIIRSHSAAGITNNESVNLYLHSIVDADASEAAMESRNRNVEDIRRSLEIVIRPAFKNQIAVRVFGSTLTGLTSPRSDIDMTVITDVDDPLKEAQEERQHIIHNLLAAEKAMGTLSEMERVAYLVGGCIGELENRVTSKGGKRKKTLIELAEGSTRIELKTYGYLIVNAAKLYLKIMVADYELLEVSVRDTINVRQHLRDQLAIADSQILKLKKKLLYRLSSILSRNGYRDVVPVTMARIGVINFVGASKIDPLLDWQCDLVVNQKFGIENSRLIKAYLDYDKSGKVKVFLMLLKTFARSHGLNSAANGFLSSYGWIILGLHFLLKFELIPNFIEPSSEPSYCDGVDVSFTVPSTESSTFSSLQEWTLSTLLFRFFVYMFEDVDLVAEVLTLRNAGEVS